MIKGKPIKHSGIIFLKLNEQYGQATKAALYRAKTHIKDYIYKEIMGHYNIRRKVLDQYINMWSDEDKLTVYIRLKRGALPINMFNPKQLYRMRKGKQTPKGLAVSINKGKRQLIEKGFRIQTPLFTGYRVRANKKIKNLYGPNVREIVMSDGLKNKIKDEFFKHYEKRLAHELERRLK